MSPTTARSNAPAALTTTAKAPRRHTHIAWTRGVVGVLVACGLAACVTTSDSAASTANSDQTPGAPSTDNVPSTSLVPALAGHSSTPKVIPPLEDDGFATDPRYPVNMLAGEPLDRLVDMAPDDAIDLRLLDVVSLSGLPDHGDQTLTSLMHAADGLVATVECPMCTPPIDPEVYALRHGVVGPRIATGWPAAGLDGIWVVQRDGERCDLTEIDLDGNVLRPARMIACELTIVTETSLGLIAGVDTMNLLLDPDTLEPTQLRGRVIAVFDRRALVEHDQALAIVDTDTRHATEIAVPHSEGRIGHGRASPDQRLVLVVFANPAWPGPRQLLDLWILDTVTLQWSQLPGMPVAAALKSLAIDWTHDGRVAVVGTFDGVGPTIVTWTPTQRHLRTQAISSPTFVASS